MCIIMSLLKDNKFIHRQEGSALVYILIAIALLAALTMTFMIPSSQQTSSQSGFRTITDIRSQIDTIRTAVQECVLSYQGGDRNVDTSEIGTDPFARRNFPLNPDSSYFNGTENGPTEGNFAKDIKCPGNPIGTDARNHSPIFSGSNGKFMPPVPDLFEDWRYYNGKDGVFIWISTNKSDAFLKTALTKLDDQFSECEADIIDVRSGAVDLDSDSPAKAQCLMGYTCFRVRLVTNTSTAVWNGDVDGDEASCR